MQNTEIAAIIVAAGRSQRMGFDKLFYPIDGVEVLRHAVGKMDDHPDIGSLVVVAGENLGRVRALFAAHPPKKPLVIVEGGATRAASVSAGVAACPGAKIVAIHDGARPFVSRAVISRAISAAREMGAAAPALPVKDTVKRAIDGVVQRTVSRDALYAVQTPQVFDRAAFVRALAAVQPKDYGTLTDDCMVMELAAKPVRLVAGEEGNRKITTPEDLRRPVREAAKGPGLPRVGHGYDVHRLAAGRRLILGGVELEYELGLLGHSDADVLLHAVSDAVLGAAALGDIGRHFPDTDPAYEGADSLELLARVEKLVRDAGYRVAGVDATVLCQKPKLAPHIGQMCRNIAGALGMDEGAVNVKATTEEGLGFTGSGEGIAAHCVAVLAADRG
ncbi:2-C-methyl-D-erythritol 2,4-cyclodiphosphate synthase [Ruminococcaceae bacterium OttesenSCG-928-D13]|nr:2-C-methyl-D-erythritol 2,4-cyclodiphosphate synthase [Ruminococcaceae bacterium OttesenSCG-928-D13]